MREIAEKFEEVIDTRNRSYIEYKLCDLLTIILCAVLCGMDTLEALTVFANEHAAYWKEQLGMEKIPSRATFGRTLQFMDGDAIGKVMVELLQEQLGISGKVVAVDGKAICSTSKTDAPHSALQILTAYLTENGVILGQESIHDKTNEIPVFQSMLEYLNLDGKVVTADAMHCQRETCAKIIEKHGDYVIGLKKNQQSLYDDVVYYFQNEPEEAYEKQKTNEKNARRIETRICRKIKDIQWLQERHNWPGLQSVFAIERIVEHKGKTSHEVSYYISSVDESAATLMGYAREHWKIESMHWMLDVDFKEDDRIFSSENAHKTLNIMRKYALAVHKHYLATTSKRASLKSSMLTCLMDIHKLDLVLGNL